MSDVLLLLLPVSFTNPLANAGFDTYPIGLGYLAAALRKNNIRLRVINDSDAKYSVESLLQIIEAEQVRIVGLSCLLATIPTAVKFAGAVKQRFGDRVHVVLGNSYVSIDPDIVKRFSCFDSAVAGEADHFIVDHVRRILAGEDRRGYFQAEPPADLSALEFPAYELIENTYYRPGSLIPIIGTRGCPYQCGYCARQSLSRHVRTRSAENVVAEMKHRAPLTRKFYFQDDSATIKRPFVMALCDEIRRSGLSVAFEMCTRFDLIDDEMVARLKEAGCERLLLGIESGNERIRNEVMRKNLTDETIIKGMRVTQKNRMPVQLFFMLGHPEETRDALMDTVNFPLRLEKMGFRHIEAVGYHITFPIPGTPYFDWCVKTGKIKPGLLDDFIAGKLGDGYIGHWPYLVPDGLTVEDLMNYRKLATRKFHLRPRYILRRLRYDLRHPRQLMIDARHAYYVIRQGTSSDLAKVES